MKRVKFENKKVEGTNFTWYPDDIKFFENSNEVGGVHYADYSGNLVLEEATSGEEVINEPGPEKMSSLAFMDLVGDANMVTLLTLAKTDPIAELLVKKIDRADVIDFGDEIRGPKKGLMYLLSIEKLSQEEYDRIMRREFLQ